MNETAILEIIKTTGPVGACLIAAGWGLRHIQLKLSDVQEKRVADASQATAKLLELVQQQHAHMALLAKAIDGSTESNNEIRSLLEASFARLDEMLVRIEVLAPGGGRTAPRAPLPPGARR